MSAKNMTLSPAATDLGLGDMLKVQADNVSEELKKKKLQQMSAAKTGPLGDPLAGSPAAMSLFGGGLGL